MTSWAKNSESTIDASIMSDEGYNQPLSQTFASLGNPLALAGRRFSSLAREHPLLSELSGEYRLQ